MSMSANTNVGQMIARQNLTATNRKLEDTPLHVTAGLCVNGRKDNAATFAVAQNMRGDLAGMGALKTTLGRGQAAGEAIAGLFTRWGP